MVGIFFAMPFCSLLPGVLVTALPVYGAFRARRRMQLISQTELCAIDDLGTGPAKVKGRIVAQENLLSSPLSRTPCVYFQFTVQELGTVHNHRHGSSSQWVTIINDRQAIAVTVEDKTGEVRVRLEDAEVTLSSTESNQSGMFNDPPARLKRLLRDHDNTSTKGLLFNRRLKYVETILQEGERVVVVGDVASRRSGPVFRKGEVPLLVSDKSEKQLSGRYQTYFILCLCLAVFLGVVFFGATLVSGFMAFNAARTMPRGRAPLPSPAPAVAAAPPGPGAATPRVV